MSSHARTAALFSLVVVLSAAGYARPAAPPTVRRDRQGDPLPPGAIARLGTLRYRLPASQSLGLAFTADGERLVSATDSAVEVIDAKTGRRVRSIPVGFHARGFALSRDGKRAAVSGFRSVPGKDSESTVRVVEVATGKEVRSWSRGKESGDHTVIAFSPDGKLLASLSYEGLFRLEEIRGGDEVLRHRFPASYPGSLTFSADGSALALVASKVFVWRWKTGDEPTALAGSDHRARSPSFAPDGKTLLAAAWGKGRLENLPGGGMRVVTGDPSLALIGAASGEIRRVLTLPGESVGHVAYRPDGKRYAVAVTGPAARVRFYDGGGEPSGSLGLPAPARALAYSSDGERVVVSLDDSTCLVYRVPAE